MYYKLYKLYTYILNLAEMCHIYKYHKCNSKQCFEKLVVRSVIMVL